MSVKEQIENWCVHFNGIQNGCCKIGIKYEDVRGEEKPYKFPCLNKSKLCDKLQLPTPEQVQEEIEELKSIFTNP